MGPTAFLQIKLYLFVLNCSAFFSSRKNKDPNHLREREIPWNPLSEIYDPKEVVGGVTAAFDGRRRPSCSCASSTPDGAGETDVPPILFPELTGD
ncbi:hypothetical protein TNIN_350581 [Trichonephila inaurata madagascariensis]|uniref:Uncharacterized protein n=1 Tax=Trichonephila inaurata madagascariensis TaxID=2747483 RepID=A0A8X7CG79_9ARAC|nr:hypothetical protein TNIN_350581 [Trichonephila inaurata madagascariensis]